MWFVLRTAPRREIDAAQEINAAGIGSYLPLRWELYRPSRHSKRREQRAVALLPGYCFALAQDGGHLLACLLGQKRAAEARGKVPATRGAVSIEGRPVAIPESVIGKLREIEASREFDDREPPIVIIAVGNHVVIETGPFQGRSGRVLQVGKRDEEGRPKTASISIGGVPVRVSTSVLRVAA